MNPQSQDAQTRHNEDGMSRRMFLQATGSTALLAAGSTLVQAGRAYPEGANKTIRMGVCGGGFGASFHWHEHPNCVVTGVTDLRPERRERLKNHYKCDTAYDSLEEMVAKAKDIDAVAIFSGAPDHVKHATLCMNRGWHVVSAVPACISLEEANALKDAKEKAGLTYMMAESSWYNQPCIFARNLYREGGFGELNYSEVEYYHNFPNMYATPERKGTLFRDKDGQRTWRWGLTPMLYPTHSTGYLTGVTGEWFTKVSCLGWGTKNSVVLEDNPYDNKWWNMCALMKTDKGHMCRCNVFWNTIPCGERAQWWGEKATLYMAVGGGLHGDYKIPGGEVKVPEYWKTSEMLPPAMRKASGHGGSAIFISAEFINALLEKREPECDLYDSLAMTVPGIVAVDSARKDGEQLKIPQFQRPKA